MPVTIGLGGNGNIITNDRTITSNTTMVNGTNHLAVGPITINNGVTVTVNSGSFFVII